MNFQNQLVTVHIVMKVKSKFQFIIAQFHRIPDILRNNFFSAFQR
jgi:hypothetical protein